MRWSTGGLEGRRVALLTLVAASYARAMSELIPEEGSLETGRSRHRKRRLIIAIGATLLLAIGWYLYLLLDPGMRGAPAFSLPRPRPPFPRPTDA